MDKELSIPLGVVVERREIDNPWQKWSWSPVAVIPGARAVEGWVELARDRLSVRYHAATLPLVIHRSETEAYRLNLSNERPVVYVVLAPNLQPDAEHDYQPVSVTVSPYEAQDSLDSGEEIVEGVTMPDGMIAWVQAFIDAHHVDEPFKKRKRRRYATHDVEFGRPPPVSKGRKDRGDS
jgi:hypothetical protein